MKIKITEFFDRQEYEEQLGHRPPGTENDGPSSIPTQPPMNPGQVVDQNQNPNPQFFGQGPLLPQQPAGGWNMPSNMSGQPEISLQQYMPPPGLPPQKFYTFQRVNGNGGNGKGDGVAGPHKHTLEESDRVKKNSVIRWQMKADKEDKKKSHVSSSFPLCVICCFLALLKGLVMIACNEGPSCQRIERIRHIDACLKTLHPSISYARVLSYLHF